jgi:8-oxo-dGTP diphosphatase
MKDKERMKKSAESKELNEDASNYDIDAYQKPSVTVDIAVCTFRERQVQVLLVKRNFPPFKNAWALPGGFVSIEARESLEAAALRQLKAKTGITDVYLDQLKTYGDPARDPRMRVITVAYFALLPFSIIANLSTAQSDENAQWFSLHELPVKLAFDHRLILTDLAKRLEGKISYTPIAFNLLDKQFTWAELQAVYEDVLAQKLLTPNFRRKILSMYHLRELQDKKKTGGRPSAYLEFEGEKEF